MPNSVFLILLLAALACGACRPDAAPASGTGGASNARGGGLVIVPEGAARPYFHDFGARLWGEQIEHTYVIENREGRTVVVQDLLPDCSCTMPRATVVLADGSRIPGPFDTRDMGLSVPADAKLEVRVGLDTTRVERPNQDKLAQVRMRSDSTETPYMTFELHVLVKRTFRAVPAEAVLKDVPQTGGKSVRLDLSTDVAGDGSRIRGIETVEGPFTAELTEAEVSGLPVWILVVRAEPGSNLGPHEGRIVMGTTLADGSGPGQHFEVKVRAQIVEDCVIEPRLIAISREADGSSSATLHALIPGAKVRVRTARVDGPASASLRVEWDAIDPDTEGRAARWRITVSAASELPREGFSGKVVVELDDPDLPLVEAPYAARPAGA